MKPLEPTDVMRSPTDHGGAAEGVHSAMVHNFQRLVANGHAVLCVDHFGNLLVRLDSGKTFLLGRDGVTRVV